MNSITNVILHQYSIRYSWGAVTSSFNFTCYGSLLSFCVEVPSPTSARLWLNPYKERSSVDDNLMSKHFNFQYSHYLTVFLAETVCFTDLSHCLQSFHQLLVGWAGGDPEPCLEHLPLAGIDIFWIVLFNHIQFCVFNPQL